MGGNPRKESCAVLTRSWNWFEASSAMEEQDKWRWGSPFCLMWPLWTPGIIHISMLQDAPDSDPSYEAVAPCEKKRAQPNWLSSMAVHLGDTNPDQISAWQSTSL